MRRCLSLGTLLLALAASGCAKKIPLPEHLKVSGVQELQQRMQNSRAQVDKYFAEARLTYFGPQGRVKGTASLAVARPTSLRYDLIGPHGGVVEAFATNGEQLQLLNPGEERFLVGRASVENIDRLMAFAPLRLDPAGWVGLLFGEVDIPEHAALTYDENIGRFVVQWPEKSTDVQVRVEVDPQSARVTRAQVFRADTLMSDVIIESRDARGLPSALKMKVPERNIDLQVVLRDVEHDPENLGSEAFALQPPRGITPEPLDG